MLGELLSMALPLSMDRTFLFDQIQLSPLFSADLGFNWICRDNGWNNYFLAIVLASVKLGKETKVICGICDEQ